MMLTFMAGPPVLEQLRAGQRMANSEWRRKNHSPLAIRRLNSRHIEPRLLAASIAPQRAVLADRVGALEDPVLPGGQPGEDFRFHGFGTDEAQIGFHAGEAVRRE